MELADAKVAIVGLGLMGGSFAMAIRHAVGQITAVEIDAATREAATAEDVVDQAVGNLRSGVAGADIIVLATPVRAILGTLDELPEVRPDGCVVLDLGSTKRAVVEAMDRLPTEFEAVGGHPMCGKEVSGFAAATPNLYQDKTFILCRSRTTTKRAVRIAEEMAGASGARVMWLEPDLHDSSVAWVSHLPYFVAATLMKRVSTAAAWNDTLWQVSGTGFRDTSRLSGSDAAMMADIVATNRAEIMTSLRQYQSEMSALLEILARGEEGEIREWLIACEREHWRYRRRPGV